MSKFNDMALQDLSIFFDDLAEAHNVNGTQMSAITDNDRLMHRSKKEYDGITVGETLIFVKKSDLGSRPEAGTPFKFDSKQMYVFDCREDCGLYEIILQQNRGG